MTNLEIQARASQRYASACFRTILRAEEFGVSDYATIAHQKEARAQYDLARKEAARFARG